MPHMTIAKLHDLDEAQRALEVAQSAGTATPAREMRYRRVSDFHGGGRLLNFSERNMHPLGTLI